MKPTATQQRLATVFGMASAEYAHVRVEKLGGSTALKDCPAMPVPMRASIRAGSWHISQAWRARVGRSGPWCYGWDAASALSDAMHSARKSRARA